jgi:hypothetical protein
MSPDPLVVPPDPIVHLRVGPARPDARLCRHQIGFVPEPSLVVIAHPRGNRRATDASALAAIEAES